MQSPSRLLSPFPPSIKTSFLLLLPVCGFSVFRYVRDLFSHCPESAQFGCNVDQYRYLVLCCVSCIYRLIYLPNLEKFCTLDCMGKSQTCDVTVDDLEPHPTPSSPVIPSQVLRLLHQAWFMQHWD